MKTSPSPWPPARSTVCWLTHAHIDHSGLLPLLVQQRVPGQDLCHRRHRASCARIMLRDSAHIQEFEAEWKQPQGQALRRTSRWSRCTPSRTPKAAIEAPFRGVDYGDDTGSGRRRRDPRSRTWATCWARRCIEIWVTEDGETKKLVFSGDIGNTAPAPHPGPAAHLIEADYVVMESTYGDRLHGARAGLCRPTWPTSFSDTFDRGGNVVIPSFAVGRTQELLYFIREIKEKGLVKGHGNFPVYVDSPLAIEATRIFTAMLTRTALTRRPAPC